MVYKQIEPFLLMLPTEVIEMIFEMNPSSMFLINKHYTECYLRPKYEHVYYQKNCILPLFKNSVYPYEKWVKRLGLFIQAGKYTLVELQSLRLLLNCSLMDVYIQSIDSEDDYAISLECTDFNEIIKVLELLNSEFMTYDQLFTTRTCELVVGLHLLCIEAPIPNVSLKSLTLFYANEEDLSDSIYPNITHLKIYEYESQSIDVIHSSFPNLEFLSICMTDILKCSVIPNYLNKLELGFLHDYQESLPRPLKSISSISIKVPFPFKHKSLFEDIKCIPKYTFSIGHQLCITNAAIKLPSHKIFGYTDFSVILKNIKYTCDTFMIKQLALLIGSENTLQLSHSFNKN